MSQVGAPYVVGSATSKAAAKSIVKKVPALVSQVFAEVYAQGPHGATCDELEVALGLKHQTCSARVRDLAKAGSIVNSGKKRPTRSGRDAVVYVVPVGGTP